MVKPVKIPITATDKTGKAFGSVKGRLGGLSSSVKKAGVLLAGAFAVKAIAGFAKEIIDLGDEFQKTSLRIGVGVEALSQYRTVAELSGFSFDKFTTGLKKLQKSSQDAAAGLSTAKRGFDVLGISVEKFKNLKADIQFEVMIEALGRLESSSLRTQVAMDLMGRSGVDLLTVVEGGAEGIRDMRIEIALLGGTMTEQTAKEFAEFNDAVTLAGVGLEALGRGILEFVLPLFTLMADNLSENIKTFRRLFGLNEGIVEKIAADAKAASEAIVGSTNVLTAEQQKAADAAEKLREKQSKVISQIKLENAQRRQLLNAYKRGSAAVQELTNVIAIENEATRLNIDFTSEMGKQWLEAARKAQVLGKEVTEAGKRMNELKATGMEMGRAIAGGFENVILKAESVKDALKGVIAQIAQIALRKAIIDPIAKSAGAFLGDLFGSFPKFASGGSFEVGGKGGTDNNLVAFKATKGETVDIRTPGQQRAAAGVGVTAGPTIFADMRGASVEAVQRLERLVADLNGSIEPRSINAVVAERQRNPALFGGA